MSSPTVCDSWLISGESLRRSALDQSSQPLTDFEVTRTLTGASQALGRLRVTLQNSRKHDINLLYVESMPWFVAFYLHTLTLTVDGVRRGMLIDKQYQRLKV